MGISIESRERVVDVPHLAELAALIERGRVTTDHGVLEGFQSPERGTAGTAACLIEPADVDELSQTAAWAYRHHQRLVIQGANSGLVGGSTPDGSGHQGVLGLNRMNRLIDFDPDARIAVVESGLRLSDLNRTLADAGQFFPIELGSDPTIGGMAATNAGGAKTIRYGNTAAHVLGVEAVLADEAGSRLGSASTLIKDSSRLKLERLLVGSFGALGVIGKLAIRTAPLPRCVATALVAPTSPHHVLDLLSSFEQGFHHPTSAFEFISSGTIDLVTSTTPGFSSPLGNDHPCQILIEVESRTADLPELEEDLARHLDKTAADKPGSVVDAVIAPAATSWGLRHSLSEGVSRAGATVRFDISVPRTSLPAFHDFVLQQFGGTDVALSEFGHWGDGGTHLALVYPDGHVPEDVGRVRETIYDMAVRQLGGSFSAEHGLGPHNAQYYRKYVPEGERALEHQLKLLFDPHLVWGSAPFV